jgi:hypothetical protein
VYTAVLFVVLASAMLSFSPMCSRASGSIGGIRGRYCSWSLRRDAHEEYGEV